MAFLIGHETGCVLSEILMSSVGELTILLLVKLEKGPSSILLSAFFKSCNFGSYILVVLSVGRLLDIETKPNVSLLTTLLGNSQLCLFSSCLLLVGSAEFSAATWFTSDRLRINLFSSDPAFK